MRTLLLLLFSALALEICCGQRTGAPNQRRKKPISRELEIIYTKGLQFLATTQSENGAWETNRSYGRYPGTVALGMLAFLAYGDDPNHGKYSKNIKRALDYILILQQSNGYIGSFDRLNPRGTMYNHGFATLALAEAYGMVNDDRLGPALNNAVSLILSSQKRNPLGAWRYSPTAQDADSTVAGCQIVALFAARNAGIPVPQEAFDKGLKYMESCRNKATGSYGYTSSSGGRMTLTAIGILCQALAKKQDTDAFKKSLEYLSRNLNYRDPRYPYYYEYYMSQALFQANEQTWNEWNKKNIKFLKLLQQPDGSINGSKGKAFSTASSLLSLALNYRFLPIYEK